MSELEQVWARLREVPDPEIPVISLVDLGIIRDVEQRGAETWVVVSPTYSGCPATTVIENDIRKHLSKHGLEVQIERRIAPPWTTDWITNEGRAALKAYGIAPPSGAKGPEECPHCGGHDLERVSQFGSTPCKALWRCNDCKEPFDYFKCI